MSVLLIIAHRGIRFYLVLVPLCLNEGLGKQNSSVSLVHFVPLGVKRLSVKILFFVNYFQS